MLNTFSFLKTSYLPRVILLIAGLILAYKPVTWLLTTWQDPSYDSHGFVIFLICAGLFIWSVTSPKVSQKPVSVTFPFFLLLVSALVRLVGQVLAINMIGAIMLVIDVYALSRLAGVQQRSRAISPLWLSICFAFSLPLERLLQRTIGYGLQNISADGACLALKGLYENVRCEGVRLFIDQQDVLVDLPCSGAQALLLLLFFFSLCAAVCRFRLHHALVGFALVTATAVVTNILRITFLAIGIAYPQTFGGINVMAQPWHDLIGLLTLALGTVPVILWARAYYSPVSISHRVLDQACWGLPSSLKNDSWWLLPRRKNTGHIRRMLASCCFLCVALLIVNLQGKPVDIARPVEARTLPYQIAGIQKSPVALSKQEERYFRQYGGGVEKALYQNIAVMSVSTTAPLRHLHAPDECLRGLGMSVTYQGLTYDPLPSAIYKATDANGDNYRIAVSFISQDQKIITTNVAEAIWYWFQNPNEEWTALQRISPWNEAPQTLEEFDLALITALDLQLPSIQFAQLDTEGEYYDEID